MTKSLRIFDQPSITHSQLILNNLSNYSFKTSSLNKLVGVLLSIRRFIRENPDVISIRADKNNVTVALNKKKYLEKISVFLKDSNTYVHHATKKPTKTYQRTLRVAREVEETGVCYCGGIYEKLNYTNEVLPRAYSVPMIH